MIELHKIIILCTTFSCVPNFFYFFFHEIGWQGGVFKVVINDYFLVFLAV